MTWVRSAWTRRVMSAFFMLAFLWGAFHWVQLVMDASPPPPYHGTHHT